MKLLCYAICKNHIVNQVMTFASSADHSAGRTFLRRGCWAAPEGGTSSHGIRRWFDTGTSTTRALLLWIYKHAGHTSAQCRFERHEPSGIVYDQVLVICVERTSLSYYVQRQGCKVILYRRVVERDAVKS